MINAEEAVVWINRDERLVMVTTHSWRCPEDHGLPGHWVDPIGAAYKQWLDMTDQQRVNLMLETAIDLAMMGIPMKLVLEAFATIKEFRALGSKSYPMCRALTKALVGKSFEFNTMSFEELLIHYRKEKTPGNAGSMLTELRNEIDGLLKIRSALLAASPGGLTRTDIRNLFHHHRPGEEIAAALETLRTAGLALVTRRKAARGPWVRETWYAT